jgi:hypothetical protein
MVRPNNTADNGRGKRCVNYGIQTLYNSSFLAQQNGCQMASVEDTLCSAQHFQKRMDTPHHFQKRMDTPQCRLALSPC